MRSLSARGRHAERSGIVGIRLGASLASGTLLSLEDPGWQIPKWEGPGWVRTRLRFRGP